MMGGGRVLEFMGFPVVIDENVQPGTAEVRDSNGNVLVRIVNLPIDGEVKP